VVETLVLKPEDDLSQASILLQRFFREEGFDTPDEIISRNLKTMVSLSVCAVIIAFADEQQIGIATASLDFGIEFGWSAEMGDLYVLPGWRGKGISLQLVKAVEALLIEKGAVGYQVTVTPYASDHHQLQGFYKRLGFADEGRLLFYKTLR
jgi:GNAT superfamily N-acetyltransferase